MGSIENKNIDFRFSISFFRKLTIMLINATTKRIPNGISMKNISKTTKLGMKGTTSPAMKIKYSALFFNLAALVLAQFGD